MLKKKKILFIVIAVAVVLLILLLILFRTPTLVSRLEDDLSGVRIVEIKYGEEWGKHDTRSCHISDEAKMQQLAQLFLSANFKYNYDDLRLGLDSETKLYELSFDFDKKVRKRMDIEISQGFIKVYIDGQSVSFGLFGDVKYEGDKVQFVENLLEIVQGDWIEDK